MKLISLPIFSLIFTLNSTILMSNPSFAQIQPVYSNNKSSKKSTFRLPPPPPGKPPGGRSRGGGRRGPCPDLGTNPNLTAIVPFTQNTIKVGETEVLRENVWGLTTQASPQFPFYVPFTEKDSLPTEFLLRDEESKEIIYQSVVKLPNKPGVINISLPKTVKPLEENKNYRWYFNIYCETQKPIPSLRVEGVVRRVKLSEELATKINAAKPRDQVELYAAEGIWFNAINTLTKLREQEPENKEFVENWQSLLESIKLSDISEQPLVLRKKVTGNK
ncbi:MAG: DUF928 domain-containing protein [Cyanobacteria bacterium P01_D01_bin.116]